MAPHCLILLVDNTMKKGLEGFLMVFGGIIQFGTSSCLIHTDLVQSKHLLAWFGLLGAYWLWLSWHLAGIGCYNQDFNPCTAYNYRTVNVNHDIVQQLHMDILETNRSHNTRICKYENYGHKIKLFK